VKLVLYIQSAKPAAPTTPSKSHSTSSLTSPYFFACGFFAGDFFVTPLGTLFAFGAAFGFAVLVPDLGLGTALVEGALGLAAAFASTGFFVTAFFAGDFFVTPLGPTAAAVFVFVFGAGFGFVVFVPEIGFVAAFPFAGALGFGAGFFVGLFAGEGGGGGGFLVVAARGRCLRVPAARAF
jgi:hypothetical protein